MNKKEAIEWAMQDVTHISNRNGQLQSRIREYGNAVLRQVFNNGYKRACITKGYHQREAMISIPLGGGVTVCHLTFQLSKHKAGYYTVHILCNGGRTHRGRNTLGCQPGRSDFLMFSEVAGASHKAASIRSGRRGRGRCDLDQAILEAVVNLALLAVAQIPPVGFFQPRLERRRLEPQDPLRFHHHFRDGR
jgi:hypothetical protein